MSVPQLVIVLAKVIKVNSLKGIGYVLGDMEKQISVSDAN
ncbi:hypothetical protein COO91_03591 [Nostoc flagelliforme CCNUN1]|uniref:Uncharacterized protein n=1 Tax=Nostoc flagelliforme CCNUN1 TaxID=2038116 RepID=A0A2K8SS58_9NOSO|nr:hypothetical protein COO91_03591 [Nostoc flagelliforme CCNUN1]